MGCSLLPRKRTAVPNHTLALGGLAALRRTACGSLAESRWEVVLAGSLFELDVVGMQPDGALEQHRLLFADLGVGHAALDRADGLAGLVVVEAHALGAELGGDHVDLV